MTSPLKKRREIAKKGGMGDIIVNFSLLSLM